MTQPGEHIRQRLGMDIVVFWSQHRQFSVSAVPSETEETMQHLLAQDQELAGQSL
jgi:hypothetical protein